MSSIIEKTLLILIWGKWKINWRQNCYIFLFPFEVRHGRLLTQIQNPLLEYTFPLPTLTLHIHPLWPSKQAYTQPIASELPTACGPQDVKVRLSRIYSSSCFPFHSLIIQTREIFQAKFSAEEILYLVNRVCGNIQCRKGHIIWPGLWCHSFVCVSTFQFLTNDIRPCMTSIVIGSAGSRPFCSFLLLLLLLLLLLPLPSVFFGRPRPSICLSVK